jgi:hypothetical protein
MEGAIVALPSAAIGLLVGAIAGAMGKPLRGAVVGFALSAVVFETFMCACASALPTEGILGRPNAGMAFLTEMLPYTLLMGLAGAAAGGIGGAVAIAARKNGESGGETAPGPGGPVEPGASADRPRESHEAELAGLRQRIKELEQRATQDELAQLHKLLKQLEEKASSDAIQRKDARS